MPRLEIALGPPRYAELNASLIAALLRFVSTPFLVGPHDLGAGEDVSLHRLLELLLRRVAEVGKSGIERVELVI